jgi:simple sugar transport system permease protein
MFKKLLNTNEFLVALVLVVLSVLIGSINPVFFTLENLFDVLRSASIMGIFALGVLIVIISGGIDVSFTAIAIFSMYVTVKYLLSIGYEGTVALPFLIGGIIGLLLGLVNAAIISWFKIPTLIATLGTQSLYRGFMLFFVGSEYYSNIPAGMTRFARTSLISMQTPSGSTTSLHSSILILAAASVIVWLILRYTMLGRGIYALGGAPEAAERAGFNIRGIQFFIYGFVGLLAGIGGIVFGSLFRQANPFSIVGSELDIIAAVVLGGALITGGRGTVLGTLLGIILVTIMNNSLILIGVPSTWQKVVIGAIIIFGTGIPAYQSLRTEKRMRANII